MVLGASPTKGVVIVVLVVFAHHLHVTEALSQDHHDWTYDNQASWRFASKQCSGSAQSPIDIQSRNVIHNNQLKLLFYNYNQFTRFKLQNAHHTIKLNPIVAAVTKSAAVNPQQRGAHAPDDVNQTAAADEASPASFVDADPHDDPMFIVTSDQANQNGTVTVTPSTPAQQSSPSSQRHHQSRLSKEQLQAGAAAAAAAGATAQGHKAAETADDSTNPSETDAAPNELTPYNGAPTIKLDWLDDGNNEFTLHDIHFHWAERKDNGSEHAIDGRRSAMEMHLVHIKHGLDKKKVGFTSDSIAVIAVLIESYRKSNADFNPIVNALGRINMTQEVQEIEYKTINDLLPGSLSSFYTYSGSLTTPPCYQVVNWVVMSDRLLLNAKQIEMFRNLYAPVLSPARDYSPSEEDGHDALEREKTNLIMPNVRVLQPVRNRPIMASFAPYNRVERIEVRSGSASSRSSVLQLGPFQFGVIVALTTTLILNALVHKQSNKLFAT